MERRRFLQLAGSGSLTLILGGCRDANEPDGKESPAKTAGEVPAPAAPPAKQADRDNGGEPLDADQRKRLAAAIQRHRLQRFAAKIEASARECLALVPGRPAKDAPLGATRFGGVPDLPRGMAWPADKEGKQLCFLAQVDLAAVPALRRPLLPREGRLFFFIGLDEPASDVEHKVLYSPPDAPPPRRLPKPDRNLLANEGYGDLKPCAVTVQRAISLPSYGSAAFRELGLEDEPPEDGKTEEEDATFRYFDVQGELLSGSQMLGYPDHIGGSPPKDAFMIRSGRSPYDYEWMKKHKETVAAGAAKWILLLQLESHRNVGLCFWDAGTFHVLIREDDLKTGNFSRTYAGICTS